MQSKTNQEIAHILAQHGHSQHHPALVDAIVSYIDLKFKEAKNEQDAMNPSLKSYQPKQLKEILVDNLSSAIIHRDLEAVSIYSQAIQRVYSL